MTLPSGNGEEALHRALCVRHQNCKELHFCFDCGRVFCAECRTFGIERLNHISHRTSPLQEALQQRLERLAAIRVLIDEYVAKHDSLLDALQKLENEQQAQLDDLNNVIDEFATQLHREVDNIKNETKQTIAKRAATIWAANPESTRQNEINKELTNLHEARVMIDHEVCLCERDELYLVEKNKDMESFASELSEFLKKTYQIPEKSCYNLYELRRELLDQMAQLNRSKYQFIRCLQEPSPFPRPEKLSIVPNSLVSVPKEKLLLHNDRNELWIRGVMQALEKSNAIYFVDAKNSKIKLLNLNSNQLTELFSGHNGTELSGLTNVNDDLVDSLVATTEHTSGPPSKVQALFLRRIETGKLEVVQRIVLHEDNRNATTFARWPAGNVLCAGWGSTTLHELCRSRKGSQLPFEDKPREHRLPANVRVICGLQSNGECRLAATFDDDTLRVFRIVGGALSELQRVPPPYSRWSPWSLVALPGGSLIVRSGFVHPEMSLMYCIECCAVQPDGSLSAPKRLLAQKLGISVWGLLIPTEAFSNHRIVVFNETRELCLYPIQP